jgi:23S rRNA (adenine2503-C2)-methyltransferase
MRRLGERAFHGKQVFRWIHTRGVTDPAKMTDLPASLRAKLAEPESSGGGGLGSVMSVVSERRASDDTRKLLVSLADGANVETVHIPRVAG